MSHKNYQKRIEKYVSSLFDIYPDKRLLYHNILHTQEVINHIDELCRANELSEEEEFICKRLGGSMMRATWLLGVRTTKLRG